MAKTPEERAEEIIEELMPPGPWEAEAERMTTAIATAIRDAVGEAHDSSIALLSEVSQADQAGAVGLPIEDRVACSARASAYADARYQICCLRDGVKPKPMIATPSTPKDA